MATRRRGKGPGGGQFKSGELAEQTEADAPLKLPPQCANWPRCWGRWFGRIALADEGRSDGLCGLCAEKGEPYEEHFGVLDDFFHSLQL